VTNIDEVLDGDVVLDVEEPPLHGRPVTTSQAPGTEKS
jgi:hypothetical protein